MLKIRIIIAILLFCGVASAQGVYTPATPTIYGEQQLRYKPVIVQHLPMKDELTVNTNDTTAQLFILKSDLSLWQYTFTGGFVKVTGSGGGGGGGGEPLIIDVVGPYLEAVDDHTLNAKGWGIQNVLDTGSVLNKNAGIDAANHTFSINSASQIHFNSFDLGAGGVASGLNLQSNDVNVSQSDNAFSSKLSFPSSSNLQGNHYIPLSVGGVFADETGNISGGGGSVGSFQDVTDVGAYTTNNFGIRGVYEETGHPANTAVIKKVSGVGVLQLSSEFNPDENQSTYYAIDHIQTVFGAGTKINYPSQNSDHYLPLSVNGNFAGDDGNITVDAGGGSEGLQDVTDINRRTTAVIEAGGYNAYSDPTTQVAALAPGLNFGDIDGVLTLKSTNTNVAVIRPVAALPATVSLTLPSSSGTFALLSDITSGTAHTVRGESFTGSTSSTITLAHTYISGTIAVYKNGVRISGFTEATGTTITLTDARLSGDTFLIDYNY